MGTALLLAGMGGDDGVYCPDLGGCGSVGRKDRDWLLDRLCRSADRCPDRHLFLQGRETTLALGQGIAVSNARPITGVPA